MLHALALVAKPATGEAGEKAFIATVLAREGSAILKALDSTAVGDQSDHQERRWYITPVCNTATAGRVWEALRCITASEEMKEAQDTSPLMKVILHGPCRLPEHGDMFSPSRLLLDDDDDDDGRDDAMHPLPLRRAVRQYCRDCGLNPSQVRVFIGIGRGVSREGNSSRVGGKSGDWEAGS